MKVRPPEVTVPPKVGQDLMGRRQGLSSNAELQPTKKKRPFSKRRVWASENQLCASENQLCASHPPDRQCSGPCELYRKSGV